MNLAMKFESFAITEIYAIVQSMLTEDEAGSGFNSGLAVFEQDILPLLQDQMARLVRVLRKKFC